MTDSWKGLDGESKMTEADWQLRGLQQAMAMQNGLDPFLSSVDNTGIPTGGLYNGDYQGLSKEETIEKMGDKTYDYLSTVLEPEIKGVIRRYIAERG